MFDDIFLLLIGSVVAARFVALLLSGAWRDRLPYMCLLGADLAALGVARSMREEAGAIGFLSQGIALVLVFMPSLLDSLQARAERRGIGGLARALLLARAREIFMPGRSAQERRRAAEQQVHAAGGSIDRLLTEVDAEIARTTDSARARQLQGERLRVLLAGSRADEAIEYAKQHMMGVEAFASSPELTAAMSTALSQRQKLHEAAGLLVLLEMQATRGDLSAQPLLLSTRLAFIAGAGLREQTDRLLAMPSVTRTLAPAEIERVRRMIAATPFEDTQLRASAAELAARLLEVSERANVSIFRRMPLTLALVTANVAAMGAMYAFGLQHDELGLARAGALFRPAVLGGEWWRLVTAAFLHAEPIHLAANMYGLYLLGRATEELLGWQRLFIIYAVSMLGGALASLWADRGLSIGASGAIMGVFAALTVVVFARRHQFYPAARRMLLGNLFFLAVLQAFLGWQIPQIDSAAHAGGFVAGLLATAGMMPTRSLSQGARRALAFVSVPIAIVIVVAGVFQIRRPLDETLLALPTRTMDVDGVRLEVPVSWERDASGLIADRHLGIEMRVAVAGNAIRVQSPQADDPRVRPLLERISKGARATSQPAPASIK